jgi:ketosteroid isomerase-like protein
MRNILGVGSVLLCTIALAACSSASRGLTDREVTAVRESMDAYVRTTLASDWDNWGKLLLSDVVAMPPNHAPLIGREAVVAYVKTYPRITKFTITTDEITGRGDVAYARGRYSITTVTPDGKSSSEKGSFLEIHKRQSDGTWPYSRFIWHSDTPLPEPAAGK